MTRDLTHAAAAIAYFLALMALPATQLQAAATVLVHNAGERVPLGDGIHLSAHVFRESQAEPRPVILSFTPYAIQELVPRARFFAASGYVFVAVSVRGRGDSDGDFQPFADVDGDDAAEAIAWAAQQPWSNGTVGMWGGSYLGYAQWAAAGRLHPALKTIVPAAAVYPGVDYPIWRNVKMAYMFQWLAAMQGRSDWFVTAFDDEAWTNAVRDLRSRGGAFAELALRSGQRAAIARSWLLAPTQEARWLSSTPSESDLGQMTLPVLSITGQFDGDQRGAMAHHARLLANSRESARRSFLVVGPWDHSGTRSPAGTMAGERVDSASVIDMNVLHRQWYDWILKDGPRPELLCDHLVYFTLGDGRWHCTSGLDALDTGVLLYPTSATGNPTSVNQAGSLARAPAAHQSMSYRFDTRNASLSNPIGFEALPGDTRDVDALRGDGLVFDTPPIDDNLELTGRPRFSAWITSARRDGDVFASILVIPPEGRSLRLGHDMIRLRHRDGSDSTRLMQPGTPERLTFDGFGFVSRVIPKGSILRLVLHSNTPAYLEHNYGGGGAVASERAEDGGPQVVTLLQRDTHRSELFLPLRPYVGKP